jgi:predicted amidophosphoribosyltransferase
MKEAAMANDQQSVTCRQCGREFPVTIWTRERSFCESCATELDRHRGTVFDVGSKLPRPEDWPDVPTSGRAESEVERQQRYTEEDHRRATDDSRKE